MAHRDEYLERLASVPLFADLDRDELNEVAALGTDVEIEEGRVLTREGEPANEGFLVVSGSAVAAATMGLLLVLRLRRGAVARADDLLEAVMEVQPEP